MNRPKETTPIAVPDLTAERFAALHDLVPEAFTEGRIDVEKLRTALGDFAADDPERYAFSWAGKRDALRLLQSPTRATLLPAPGESLDFETTGNIFIEGDNLEVLKLLYRPYFGRVKMIYIDPPYNTGNDFIYPDDYRDPLGRYLELTGQQDAEGNLLTSNPETSGRYHSAWLSMMYPRLFLARQLLREDGVIFVSIDDHEVHNLRMVMNEVFGEENFVASIIWEKLFSPKNDARYLSDNHDFVLLYARAKGDWNRKLLPRDEKANERYTNPDDDPRGPWASSDLLRMEHRANSVYTIVSPTGVAWTPEPGTSWRHPQDEINALMMSNEIWFGADGNSKPRRKRYLADVRQGIVPQTIWDYESVGHNQEGTQVFKSLFEKTGVEFNNPKPPRLIERMLQITTDNDEKEIILDFFSGSGSTAQAVLELNREDGGNRRFILVQLPEPTGNPDLPTIAEIGKERIRRVVARMNGENDADDAPKQAELPLETRETPEDLGFRVYKLAPSNFADWVGVAEDDPESYTTQMALFRDPLRAGWTPEGVLTELAIKHGFSLAARFEALPGTEALYRVRDPESGLSFYASLAPKLALADLAGLGLTRDDRFICRDAALDDETAANLALQCRLETI